MFIWTMSDFIGLAFFVAVALIAAMAGFGRWYRHYKCDHENYHENTACHAICRDCGKDLGFIGTIREAKRGSSDG